MSQRTFVSSEAILSVIFRVAQDEEFSIARDWHTKIASILLYTPKYLRNDPSQAPRFSWSLNIFLGVVATFTIANLYWSPPILNLLARDFHVTNERASLIPTLAQAGYAGGLFFLCPLGDLFERRPLIVGLAGLTLILWIGLCITKSYEVFCVLSFITGFTNVTPQLVLPLASDLAPSNRRATALSVIVSGHLLGTLSGRLLSGIIADYMNWRWVYRIALGLQILIFILLYIDLPAYPAKNPPSKTNFVVTYSKLLWSMLTMLTKEPVLAQGCALAFFASTSFTSFWTFLTFLLSSPPWNYSSLTIGLFSLVSLAALILIPLYSRLIIDRYLPHFSILLSYLILISGTFIGLFTARFSVVGPAIQAFTIDLGIRTSQIATQTAIHEIDPKASNRLNTAFMVSANIGFIVGAAIGTAVYAKNGWEGGDGASAGFLGLGFIVWALRGPKETTAWLGWSRGWAVRRSREDADTILGTVEARGEIGNLETGSTSEHKSRPTVVIRRL